MSEHYADYLRENILPSVWCPGCGNGVIVKAMIDSLRELDWTKDETVVVGGIGCSGRTPFFLDVNSIHTTHGRALAFATGIKLYRPELNVIVTMGDGDSVGIGGNHFIHACRRNIDLTAVIFNNAIYGQTGGQLAPTTPYGKRSTTSSEGNIDPAFDVCQLARGAGARFIARSTTFDFQQLRQVMTRALQHRGFSVVEVLTTCPTYYGRMNELRDPYEMLHYLKNSSTLPPGIADGLRASGSCAPETAQTAAPAGEDEETLPKRPTGIFVDEDRPEYTKLYFERAREARRHE